jgi:hypothetical protein
MLLERVSQTEGITARRFAGGAGEEAGEVKEIEAVVDVLCISLSRAVNLSVFHKSAPTEASSDRLGLTRPRPKFTRSAIA